MKGWRFQDSNISKFHSLHTMYMQFIVWQGLTRLSSQDWYSTIAHLIRWGRALPRARSGVFQCCKITLVSEFINCYWPSPQIAPRPYQLQPVVRMHLSLDVKMHQIQPGGHQEFRKWLPNYSHFWSKAHPNRSQIHCFFWSWCWEGPTSKNWVSDKDRTPWCSIAIQWSCKRFQFPQHLTRAPIWEGHNWFWNWFWKPQTELQKAYHLLSMCDRCLPTLQEGSANQLFNLLWAWCETRSSCQTLVFICNRSSVACSQTMNCWLFPLLLVEVVPFNSCNK